MADSAADDGVAEATQGEAGESTLSRLLRPPASIASWALVLGVYGLALAVVNLVWGLGVIGEQKAVWASYLTMGAAASEPWVSDFSFSPGSDGIMLLLVIVVAAWGAMGLTAHHDGGVMGWLKTLPRSPLWPALVSTETDGGWRRTIAAWCLTSGILFYVIWNAVYWRWIDPGVYAVTVVLIGFGFALHWVQQAEAAQA